MNPKPRENLISPANLPDEGAQVIAFRPRTSEHPPRSEAHPQMVDGPAGEPDDSGADDFKHRMLTNAAAFLFLAGLTGAGIWLAASISDLRRTQDCVLANRSNCAQIVAPGR